MSRTFLRIWADPRRAVFWRVETAKGQWTLFRCSLNLEVTAPSAPMTTGMTLTSLRCQIFLSSLFKSWYFSIFVCSAFLILVSPGTATSIMRASFFFLSTRIKSGRQCSTLWSVWMWKSHSSFTLSFSKTFSAWWLYHCLWWSKWYFLQRFQWSAAATLSCLAL